MNISWDNLELDIHDNDLDWISNQRGGIVTGGDILYIFFGIVL